MFYLPTVNKLFVIFAALLFVSCHAPRVITVDSKEAPLDIQNAPPQQTAQVFEQTKYLLYLPESYTSDGKHWPLILYLHGRSLRGEDLDKLKSYGLAAALDKGLSIPFIVVSPQCPDDRSWMDEDELLIRLVDAVSMKYGVDHERIYVTGHSMGGRGAWFLAYKQPEKFAAIIPLADGPTDLAWLKEIARVPVWAFHGTKDDLAPFARTRDFVDALKKAGAEARFTPLPDRDHFILDTYENKEIYDWLLEHKRR